MVTDVLPSVNEEFSNNNNNNNNKNMNNNNSVEKLHYLCSASRMKNVN